MKIFRWMDNGAAKYKLYLCDCTVADEDPPFIVSRQYCSDPKRAKVFSREQALELAQMAGEDHDTEE